MKTILKRIRANSIVNRLVRIIAKRIIAIGNKTFERYSLHWPIHGAISVSLPDNKSFKILGKGDFIPTQAYWKGYSGYELAIIPFYHLSKEANTIIDIGANIGYFSIIAAAANPSSEIYSFEPVNRVAERFEEQTRLNKKFNIVVERKVVGDANGNVKFFVPKGNQMSLASSTKKGWVSDVEEVSVPSITLDSYKLNQKLNKIDLIKMDCEFHELEVLKGMKEILVSDKPIIMIEILFPEAKEVKGYFENAQYIEIEKMMKENDYYFYLITKDALFRVDSLEYSELDRNYVFSSKKSQNRYVPYSNISSII